MKKYIFPIVAIVAFTLSSCHKDRTCTCTETVTVNGSGESETWTETVGHANKKEAKRYTNCYSFVQKDTQTIAGTVYIRESKRDCELK